MRHESGSTKTQNMPVGLMARLGLEFKRMEHDVHSGFDEIVVAVQQEESTDMILHPLSAPLSRFIACHATYRLEVEPGSGTAKN